VVAASRRDEFERTFVGDDTRQVLQDAPSAVAGAPNGYVRRAQSLDTIGAPGTTVRPRASKRSNVASELARERGAEVSAFEAVAEPMYASDPVSGQWALEERLDKARRQLAELRGVSPHVALGDAAELLRRHGESVDLLVVGSHESRPSDRFSGGSTSQRLADSLACPLLVLGPEPPEEA
jgi:nucleotide-binding universal stress UspA family protein